MSLGQPFAFLIWRTWFLLICLSNFYCSALMYSCVDKFTKSTKCSALYLPTGANFNQQRSHIYGSLEINHCCYPSQGGWKEILAVVTIEVFEMCCLRVKISCIIIFVPSLNVYSQICVPYNCDPCRINYFCAKSWYLSPSMGPQDSKRKVVLWCQRKVPGSCEFFCLFVG